MNKISTIGSLLKRIYRNYSNNLLEALTMCGFTDLRPSFLEVLLYVCEFEGPSIKEVGRACGLKKQTMTSHLNELERRGYIQRKLSTRDKREQNVYLTEYGEKFKLNLFECVTEIEKNYVQVLGEVELDRVQHLLKNFHQKVNSSRNNELPL